MQPKRILGIDPGSRNLGIGCIEKRGQKLRLLFAETISAPDTEHIFERLRLIAERLRARIEELQPEEIAIEDTFFGKSARSAFRLGLARGVALAICLERQVKVFEYAPTQVKLVVTGYGKADKAQVRKMASLTLGATLNLGLDATDAVAVAICHASTNRLNSGLSC
jgi:crossover junction endodeoxyribonuclease RuvC